MSNLQTYAEAVEVIKEAILRSQYRAASSANKEQLSLYYGIGCYVSKNSRNGFWGKGAIETISQQLQKELPGLRGFSAANIKFMRQFYEAWCEDLKSLTAVSGIGTQLFLIVCISFCTFVASRVGTLWQGNEALCNTNGCCFVTSFFSNTNNL